ncbi:protein of unknown function [Cyclobacterium lianum]|uniref:3-keto-alpha-glucoside-1,2-lyase/3-keto-2-hydroxy-glucal hydratase domain-containing protein n=1 Tax=Cyclobacterium lianum TaxID=388280 RepID=A0A1M7MMX1_9BACT|nr:DUF1080 domain-containing protein [Cyclobacterium lianum]SHM92346.1 protein of unknown function [Cyclobacterium lianum]
MKFQCYCLSLLAGIFFSGAVLAQQNETKLPPQATEFYEPEVKPVTPGQENHLPPADAIVLFGGNDLNAWVSERDGSFPKWKVEDGILTVAPKTGGIKTKEAFGDVQVHLEWRAPSEVSGNGQGRGNSGFFFMGKYELQILDSYDNKTYSNGQAASIYKQHPPLVNAMRPPGEWNTYDAVFTAPRFNSNGMLISPARITVFHNGILVQNNVELKGPTEYIGIPNYVAHPEQLPFHIQDHSNPVSFRNIWVRRLD